MSRGIFLKYCQLRGPECEYVCLGLVSKAKAQSIPRCPISGRIRVIPVTSRGSIFVRITYYSSLTISYLIFAHFFAPTLTIYHAQIQLAAAVVVAVTI